MTLDQLRIFTAVAELEHMTLAARALNMSQSTASAAIAALERRHHVELFHRVGRRIELTNTGVYFLKVAKEVLASASQAELMLTDISGLRRGSFKVEASHTIASYFLPKHIMHFKELYPGIEVNIQISNTAQVAKSVQEGSSDLGFIEGPVDSNLFDYKFVGRDRLVIVVGKSHPWYGSEYLDPSELTKSGWAVREEGSGTRAEFELGLQTFSLSIDKLNVLMKFPTNEALREAAESGKVAVALSEHCVADALRTKALWRLPIDLPRRDLNGIFFKGRHRSRASCVFLTMVKQAMAVTYLDGGPPMAAERPARQAELSVAS